MLNKIELDLLYLLCNSNILTNIIYIIKSNLSEYIYNKSHKIPVQFCNYIISNKSIDIYSEKVTNHLNINNKDTHYYMKLKDDFHKNDFYLNKNYISIDQYILFDKILTIEINRTNTNRLENIDYYSNYNNQFLICNTHINNLNKCN